MMRFPQYLTHGLRAWIQAHSHGVLEAVWREDEQNHPSALGCRTPGRELRKPLSGSSGSTRHCVKGLSRFMSEKAVWINLSRKGGVRIPLFDEGMEGNQHIHHSFFFFD